MTWRPVKTRFLAAKLAFAITSMLVIVPCLAAQSAGPREIAARLTGNWKLNVELTPTSLCGAGPPEVRAPPVRAPSRRRTGLLCVLPEP